MAKMQVKGLDEFIKKLEAAQRNPEKIVKKALYEGAGVVADAIRSNVASLPVDESHGTRARPKHGITGVEKAGLLSGIGISKMRTENAQVNVVIGFNGTNADGKKNTTIMRRAESGTSFQRKTPAVRPAVNRSKAAALDAIEEVFIKELDEIL